MLKSLASYKLAVSPEVSTAEKFFEEFVNLSWEDFKFNKEKLGLEEDKIQEPPKKSEIKGSHSDSEKTDKKPGFIPDGSKILLRKLKE